MKKFMVGFALAVAAALTAVAVPAGAGTPAKQGCVGESISVNAKAPGPYGAFVSGITPRNDFGSLADGLHLVQAGLAPDDIYWNTCN